MNGDDITREILKQAAAQDEVRTQLTKFAEEVRDYWRSVAPVESGRYAASITVLKKNMTVRGMPAKRVAATNFKAHWIEFGTGEPGPTPAFAPRAKTAAHFGGDESQVDPTEVEMP